MAFLENLLRMLVSYRTDEGQSGASHWVQSTSPHAMECGVCGREGRAAVSKTTRSPLIFGSLVVLDIQRVPERRVSNMHLIRCDTDNWS